MSYIKVDHSAFEPAAEAIERYIDLMKRNMGSAENEVSGLVVSWQGKDSVRFDNQWKKVADNDSTYYKMLSSLESYAKFLRFASGKYKDAQSVAVNRANSLPKY